MDYRISKHFSKFHRLTQLSLMQISLPREIIFTAMMSRFTVSSLIELYPSKKPVRQFPQKLMPAQFLPDSAHSLHHSPIILKNILNPFCELHYTNYSTLQVRVRDDPIELSYLTGYRTPFERAHLKTSRKKITCVCRYQITTKYRYSIRVLEYQYYSILHICTAYRIFYKSITYYKKEHLQVRTKTNINKFLTSA